MLLLLGEETFCDTFISLKHQLSLERMLLVSSSFQMSQPEETGGCFQEVANTTNIRLAGVLQLGTFVGELERSIHFSTSPHLQIYTLLGHQSCHPLCASTSCPQTAAGGCCAGSLSCRFPVLLKPFSSLLQLRLLSAPLYLVGFCDIETAGDEAVTSERHSSSRELKQFSAVFLCQGL